jgi:cobalt-zinc-cadmium efflux system protein
MRDATSILMEFTPRGLDIEAVRRHIEGVEHVVVDDECFRDGHAAEVLANVRACVAGHFDVSILHSTFQVEPRHLSAAEPEGVRHP